jgi:hypothetical protein
LLESGDIEGAEQMLSRMKDLSSKLREPFFSWITGIATAMISIMRGVPGAEDDALAAYRIGESAGQSEANSSYVAQLSSIRRDQGRYSELIEPVRRNAESLVHLPVWRLALAGLYCELDRHDEARNELKMLEGGGFEIPIEWTWASIITILFASLRRSRLPGLGRTLLS